jgi:hypothetical protein
MGPKFCGISCKNFQSFWGSHPWTTNFLNRKWFQFVPLHIVKCCFSKMLRFD